ncbi:unnamed protein product [Prorocentrum cordatum]|uniref:Uncharacterized protein n=1 Tax=Prorocentrum cordatum TaxID=2364126 RepID=A0ABN9WDI4_9DINO|nr:unnamed protein product [Polarella glacialis]
MDHHRLVLPGGKRTSSSSSSSTVSSTTRTYDAVDDLHKFIHTNVDNSKCNHREFQHNGVLNHDHCNNHEREFQHDGVFIYCEYNQREFHTTWSSTTGTSTTTSVSFSTTLSTTSTSLSTRTSTTVSATTESSSTTVSSTSGTLTTVSTTSESSSTTGSTTSASATTVSSSSRSSSTTVSSTSGTLTTVSTTSESSSTTGSTISASSTTVSSSSRSSSTSVSSTTRTSITVSATTQSSRTTWSATSESSTIVSSSTTVSSTSGSSTTEISITISTNSGSSSTTVSASTATATTITTSESSSITWSSTSGSSATTTASSGSSSTTLSATTGTMTTTSTSSESSITTQTATTQSLTTVSTTSESYSATVSSVMIIPEWPLALSLQSLFEGSWWRQRGALALLLLSMAIGIFVRSGRLWQSILHEEFPHFERTPERSAARVEATGWDVHAASILPSHSCFSSMAIRVAVALSSVEIRCEEFANRGLTESLSLVTTLNCLHHFVLADAGVSGVNLQRVGLAAAQDGPKSDAWRICERLLRAMRSLERGERCTLGRGLEARLWLLFCWLHPILGLWAHCLGQRGAWARRALAAVARLFASLACCALLLLVQAESPVSAVCMLPEEGLWHELDLQAVLGGCGIAALGGLAARVVAAPLGAFGALAGPVLLLGSSVLVNVTFLASVCMIDADRWILALIARLVICWLLAPAVQVALCVVPCAHGAKRRPAVLLAAFRCLRLAIAPPVAKELESPDDFERGASACLRSLPGAPLAANGLIAAVGELEAAPHPPSSATREALWAAAPEGPPRPACRLPGRLAVPEPPAGSPAVLRLAPSPRPRLPAPTSGEAAGGGSGGATGPASTRARPQATPGHLLAEVVSVEPLAAPLATLPGQPEALLARTLGAQRALKTMSPRPSVMGGPLGDASEPEPPPDFDPGQ